MEILITAPHKQFLLGCEVVVWLVNREVEQVSIIYKLLLPLLHRSTAPARNGIFVYGFALVGNNQILVNADNFTVAFAYGAGSERIVEAEQMLGGLLEFDAVGLELCRETTRVIIDYDCAEIIAIVICSCYGVTQAKQRLVIVGTAQAIDYDCYIVSLCCGQNGRQKLLDGYGRIVYPNALKSVAQELQHLIDNALPCI